MKTRVKIRFIEGDDITASFPDTMTLKNGNWMKIKAREEQPRQLRKHLYKKGEINFYFKESGSNRILTIEEHGQLILKKLFGSSAFLFLKDKNSRPEVVKGKGSIEDGKIIEHRLVETNLKGENIEEREAFEEEWKIKEAERKRKEAEERKMDLLKVRLKIEEDKLKRIGTDEF